jgi:hypothetical protein
LKKQEGVVDEKGDIWIRRRDPVTEDIKTDIAVAVTNGVKHADDIPTAKVNGLVLDDTPAVVEVKA